MKPSFHATVIAFVSLALLFFNSWLSLILFLGAYVSVILGHRLLEKKVNLIISLWITSFVSLIFMGGIFYLLKDVFLVEQVFEQWQLLQDKIMGLKVFKELEEKEKILVFQQSVSFFLSYMGGMWLWAATTLSFLPVKKAQSVKGSGLKDWASLKVPFFFVWILCLSLIGAFLLEKYPLIQIPSLNLLNLVIFSYFLQGLAIIKKYFQSLKISVGLRLISYVAIFSLGLFLPVGMLGLTEEWWPFREKIKAKEKALKK